MKKAPTAHTNARKIAPVPIHPASFPGQARNPSAITMLPASGGASTNHAYVVGLTPTSSAQLAQVVDVERQPAPVHGDDQASPTTTSHAATTMTTSANTCPSSFRSSG